MATKDIMPLIEEIFQVLWTCKRWRFHERSDVNIKHIS